VITVLLLVLASVRVYDSGSTVTMDTVSACMPMSELRRATERLQDLDLAVVEQALMTSRHLADSAALHHCQAGFQDQTQALDTLQAAEAATDHTRRSCVDSAAAIAKAAEHRFRDGILVGGGIGGIISALILAMAVILH